MQANRNLTDAEFLAVREFIYRRTGIFFTERNRFLLDARMGEILHEAGHNEALSYVKTLINSGNNTTEISRLINKVTITETSFFRDPHQISAIAKNVIPEIAKKHEQLGTRLLRIWSAGSSSGEEAYTLAILLSEHFKEAVGNWNITIFATDINDEAIQACREGVYREYALRNTPPAIRDQYFQAAGGGKYAVQDTLKKLVVAEQANLMDPFACKKYAACDLILIRNVLIYFEAAAKAQVLKMCFDNLRDNGYLFLGQSETASGIDHGFKLVSFVNAFAYKKVPPDIRATASPQRAAFSQR